MLADKVTKLREDKGLNYYKLAKKMGVPQQYITKIEDGRTKNPTWKTMIALADALGVSLDELAGRK